MLFEILCTPLSIWRNSGNCQCRMKESCLVVVEDTYTILFSMYLLFDIVSVLFRPLQMQVFSVNVKLVDFRYCLYINIDTVVKFVCL